MESFLRHKIHTGYRHYRDFKFRVAYALRFLEAQLYRRRTWVVQRWAGYKTIQDAKRIAIFAHYDRQGRLPDYVRYYLKQLQAVGYTIIFVSNSPKLTTEVLAELRSLCGLVLRRRNLGYDFGAYRDALREIPDLVALDSLILANDSVYGPFQPLVEVLRKADPEIADIWGINDSYDGRYHLQSYFLLLHRSALTAERLNQFWDRLLYVRSKAFVVRYYEIGFSRAAAAAGLRLQALCPYRALVAASLTSLSRLPLSNPGERVTIPHADFLSSINDMLQAGTPLNPSHFFWDQMLLDFNCPFLKRELLTVNPAQVPMITKWEQVVRQVSDYDTNMIVRHLQQVLRNRSV